MTKESQGKPSLFWIVMSFLAVYIIWGSAYVCNKMLVSELPPFFLSGIRFVMASLIIFAIVLASGRRTALTPQRLINAVVAGFLFLTLGNGGLVYGLQFVDSSFAALMVAGEPLVVLLLLFGLRGQPLSIKSLTGIALGIIGIYLLIGQEGLVMVPGSWKGLVAIAISMLAWGYASIFVGTADLPKNHFLNTGIQMLSGGLLLLLISVTTEHHMHSPLEISPRAWGALAYLIVFASILAFTAFNYLLEHVSPEKVSTSNYVNPVVAMILGWWLLGEQLTTQSGIAAAFLLVGVYFVNSSKKSKKAIQMAAPGVET